MAEYPRFCNYTPYRMPSDIKVSLKKSLEKVESGFYVAKKDAEEYLYVNFKKTFPLYSDKCES